jgi:hypothetical protein
VLLDVASIRNPNRAGQAYALMFLTPIAPGAEATLRETLTQLYDDAHVSPFEQLPRTHFARFVICEDFVTADDQPHPDPLGCQYLIFSCCIDGDPATYLADLATTLADVTQSVYRHCINAPQPASGPELVRYLRHNQIESGLFYSAYPDWTVSGVRRVLAQQRAMRELAVAAQQLSPADLQKQFIRELG